MRVLHRGWLKLFGMCAATAFVSLIACVAGAMLFFMNHAAIDFSVLDANAQGIPSVVLDDAGAEWMRFQLDRRDPIALDQLPPHLINAFLAAEDRKFFRHRGISWRGIFRSLLVNCYHGRSVQGASTITQQLVKMLMLTARKTFSRKLKEQCYALMVERQFSKEQILEAYLNNIYLGCGIYGVEAAAQRFWSKSAQDVTIAEAAVLAAVIRSPGNYCPLLCPLSSARRRDLILHAMQQQSFISKQQYQDATAESVQTCEAPEAQQALHVREVLRLQLERMVGRQPLYTHGFVIKTTINRYAQEKAERIFRKHCRKLREQLKHDVDGALLSIDVPTGGIKAVVGGYDYALSKFNRAFQARRQVGSIFKPIVYASAIESGIKMSETRVDEPLEVQDGGNVWTPNNYNCAFDGEVTLAYALSRSNNIVTVKTLLEVGVERVIDVAKRFHFKGPFNPYPSLALGCLEATVPEVAGFFNVFANEGRYVKPHILSWIKDRWGTKVWKQQVVSERILDSRVSGQVSSVLQLGLERACKRFAYGVMLDSEGISKTGTTNDCRTCWFVGATPSMTTAIYIGCDDNRSMGKHVYPSMTAFPIWLDLHRAVSSRVKRFTYDPRLQPITINERTGVCASKGDSEAITLLV